jgi:hypothetical protein
LKNRAEIVSQRARNRSQLDVAKRLHEANECTFHPHVNKVSALIDHMRVYKDNSPRNNSNTVKMDSTPGFSERLS